MLILQLSERVRKRAIVIQLAAVLALLATGCGSIRETFPPRSATEQLLISTAADRAVSQLTEDKLANKTVYVDDRSLEGYDHKYLLVALKRRLLELSANLASKQEDAEIIIEVASGALSVDSRSGLIGVPAIPIPVPFAVEPLKTPELPLFKSVVYTGIAKVVLTCYGNKTGFRENHIPILYGKAVLKERWYFFMGPFRTTDFDKAIE